MIQQANPPRLGFQRWHERLLYKSYAWLALCLLNGFIFVAVLEFGSFDNFGLLTAITLIGLYIVGLGVVDTFRRFWVGVSYAQRCANSATCSKCDAYGLFDVVEEARPIYARCNKCDHQWVIE